MRQLRTEDQFPADAECLSSREGILAEELFATTDGRAVADKSLSSMFCVFRKEKKHLQMEILY